MVSSSAPENYGADRLPDGTVLNDRYEITGMLGSGGFALVYSARQLKINRPVAIKVLNAPNNPQSRKAYQERFLREAQTAALIRHTNVVTIHDFGLIKEEGDHRPFIVMEHLEGHDLKHEIYNIGPMSPARLLPLFIECLEALGEGHSKNIVHKDLKPSNLFLNHPGTRKETLKVLDFGIARLSAPGQDRLTGTGQVMGTPKYYAPEYARHQLVLPALDVYQMGLILVEALSGRPAVALDDAYACLLRHCNNELEVPEALLTGPLGPVLRRALALDHEERYRDAYAFRDALEAIDPNIPPIDTMGPVRFLTDVTGSHQMLVMPVAPEPPPEIAQNTREGPGLSGEAQQHPDAVVIHSDGRVELPHRNKEDDTGPLPVLDPRDEDSLDALSFRPTVTIPEFSGDAGSDVAPIGGKRARLGLSIALIGLAVSLLIAGVTFTGLMFLGDKPEEVKAEPPPITVVHAPTADPEVGENPRSVRVLSVPAGARLYRSGEETGIELPGEFAFREGDPEELVVEARLEGHVPMTITLKRGQSEPVSISMAPAPAEIPKVSEVKTTRERREPSRVTGRPPRVSPPKAHTTRKDAPSKKADPVEKKAVKAKDKPEDKPRKIKSLPLN